jgi:gamma-glutamylcyclotransferase (GGCT)/AIG2-like uncharacterized protein YtfP
MLEHVFAYGSLAADADGHPCDLRGHRRVWGVAMDNRETVPGYKLYRRPDGSRPGVAVAFLDVERAPDDHVNGVCVPVDAARLAEFDERERNYRRVDVTHAVVGAPPGRVWAYVGHTAGRGRLERARVAGRAVVDRRYVHAVEAAFARLGAHALEHFRATTVPHGLPELELVRVDLPAG